MVPTPSSVTSFSTIRQHSRRFTNLDVKICYYCQV